MATIGSLGRKKPAIEMDFDYFGETIRVNPFASNLVEIDFLRAASGVDLDGVGLSAELTEQSFADLPPEAREKITKAASSSVDIAVQTVKRLIHPDDWDRFWATAIANGQDLQDLLEVQKAVTAAVAEVTAGFPTGPSSDSPAGPATTGQRFEVDSPSPEPPAMPTSAARALVMLRGRPDLQEFVVMNEEVERAKTLAG